MSAITVETADLRRALVAVGPHASKDPDDSALYRVRLSVGTENVSVSATNRYSAGLALMSVLEHDGELVDIDLSSQDVKEILALFKGTKGGEDEIGDTLRLLTTEQHTVVTDVSGLFPGKSLSLPKFATSDLFPSIPRLAQKILTRQVADPAERLVAAGSLLALFKSAAVAYGEPLELEMTGNNSALIVACGDSFLGLLMPTRPGEDAEALMRAHRQEWLDRFAELPELVSA